MGHPYGIDTLTSQLGYPPRMYKSRRLGSYCKHGIYSIQLKMPFISHGLKSVVTRWAIPTGLGRWISHIGYPPRMYKSLRLGSYCKEGIYSIQLKMPFIPTGLVMTVKKRTSILAFSGKKWFNLF
jgi:hypothetical protein